MAACVNTAIGLRRRGHEVTISTTSFEFSEAFAETIRGKGIEVIPFDYNLNLGLFIVSSEMRTWLKKSIVDFEVVQLQGYRSHQSNITHHYARKSSTPYVLQAHGSVLPFYQKVELKRIYDYVWGYRILKEASALIALTDVERGQYVSMGVEYDKIKVIPNGIDLADFSNLPPRGTFKSMFGIEGRSLILFLGRIHRIKGLDLLLDAFGDLASKRTDISLAFVGPDGGYLDTLNTLVAKASLGGRVLVAGSLYGREKLAAYVDADVYVLPSEYEAFPNTVLEAWGCEVPVIVTEECTISDFVRKAGLVVKRDRSELSKALTSLLDNPPLRKELGKRGNELVRSEFSLEKTIAETENLMCSLIDNPQPHQEGV